MNDEIAAYAESIAGRLQRMDALIARLDGDALNARPAMRGANSPYAIVTHTIGNARAWILGIVLGEARRRDRASEFAAAGDVASLRAAISAAERDIADALARLAPDRLSVRLTPRHELWGEGAPREISVRDAVLHVIEHASLHLGHLELTLAALAG